MKYRVSKQVLFEVFLILFIFILAFGSKALVLNNLTNYDLKGPDPYLFYRYTKELYTKGYIEIPDCLRYYPLCGKIDTYPLIAYAGYLNLILLNFKIYYYFINFLLNIFSVHPHLAFFDFGIHTTYPLLFAISSIFIFIFLSRVFRDKLLAFLLTLFFIVTPLLTYRLDRYEKEPIATVFILSSLFLYWLAMETEKTIENKNKRIIFYSLLIVSILVSLYNYFYLLILLPLFFLFKAKESYYSLSGLLTIFAMNSWGGWKIIPLIVGSFEIVKYFIGKFDKSYILFLSFIPYYFLKFGANLNTIFSTTFILVILPLILWQSYYLFNKFKVFNYFEKIKLNKKIINFLIILSFGLPILYKKLSFIISNPWLKRFGSTVAEQQPSTPTQYLSQLTKLGFILSFLGIWYLIYSLRKDNYNLLISFVLTSLFLYIVVLSNFHVIFSWIVFFIVISYIIYLEKFNKNIFFLIWSLLSFVIGDYINRLIFYVGYVFPFLVGFSIKFFDEINIKEKIKEYIVAGLLLISAISGIYLYNSFKLWVFFLPTIIFISYVFYYYIFSKDINLNIWLKYSILLFLLFGLPNNYGLFLRYIDTKFIGGTEKYLIDSLLLLKNISRSDAVVSFWWDYGYYVQTIANRTTWLDGGNAIVYWNHLMGRYGLCGNETEALELIYIHSIYDWNTFLVLEYFGKNNILDKIYERLNLTKEDLKIIYGLRKKKNWKEIVKYLLLNGFNKEKLKSYGLKDDEIKILEKIKNARYLRESYYLIHPTDIGKFYAFSKLGSNDYYDKLSWIEPMTSVISINPKDYNPAKFPKHLVEYIGNEMFIVFANKNVLSYYGKIPLDEDLNKIPGCVPELGIYNCGVIYRVDIIFDKNITKQEGLKEKLILENIKPENIKEAYVYTLYNNKVYRLKLGCVYFGRKIEFNNSEYNGCLYVTPSIYSINNPLLSFSQALFITQKAMNYLWVKLYFFEESKNFKKVIDSMEIYGYSSLIFREIAPLKIWKVEFPKNLSIPRYKYCLYLAENLKEINKCAELFGLKKYKSIWSV